MKISEMIKQLCDKLVEYGDIPVVIPHKFHNYFEEAELRLVELDKASIGRADICTRYQLGSSMEAIEVF